MLVVIPLIKASFDNIELRYTLRSHVARLGDFDLMVIGYKPPWLVNCMHYPFADRRGLLWKESNIYNKLRFAFSLPGVESFLFSNDDYYINDGYDISTYYHKGPLLNTLQGHKSSGYCESLRNTIKILGPDALDFDVHAPLMLHKKDFELSINKDTFAYHYGAVIKSLYCRGKAGTRCVDMKVKNEYFKGVELLPFFSSADSGLKPGFLNYLQSRWPNKSKFETCVK